MHNKLVWDINSVKKILEQLTCKLKSTFTYYVIHENK